MYDIVLFDLDGTIINSENGILNSIEYALGKYGAEMPKRSTLNFFLGPPLDDSFSKLLKISKQDAEILVKYYREYYREKGIFEIQLYDGVEDLLKEIKTSCRKVVLATSKPEEFAKKILKHLNIDKYFDVIAGATFDNTRSEKPDVIAYALKRVGVMNNNSAIMVGDRKFDCEGAAELGLDSIGVLYGFGSREELETAGATYLAETATDVYKYL